MRVMIIYLIIHDLFAGIYLAVLYPLITRLSDQRGVDSTPDELHLPGALHSLLQLTALLSLSISFVEAAARLLLFWKFPLSVARFLDILLTVLISYVFATRRLPELLLLSVCRLWRFWEHLAKLSHRLEEQLTTANALFDHQSKRSEALEKQVDQIKARWRWECQARERAEDQIVSYKEENATLAEMLTIAAQERVLEGGTLGDMYGTGDGAEEDAEDEDEEGDEDDAPKSRLIISNDGSFLRVGQ